MIEMVGRKIPGCQWEILSELPRKPGEQRKFRCRCACSEVHVVRFQNLRTGQSKRCRSCASAARGRSMQKHGMSRTPIYRLWVNIRRRKHDPVWDSFDAFLADVGKPPRHKPYLVRKNPNQPYGPDNFQWVKRRNGHVVYKHWFEYRGKAGNSAFWAAELDITTQYMNQLIHNKGSLERAVLWRLSGPHKLGRKPGRQLNKDSLPDFDDYVLDGRPHLLPVPDGLGCGDYANLMRARYRHRRVSMSISKVTDKIVRVTCLKRHPDYFRMWAKNDLDTPPVDPL